MIISFKLIVHINLCRGKFHCLFGTLCESFWVICSIYFLVLIIVRDATVVQ